MRKNISAFFIIAILLIVAIFGVSEFLNKDILYNKNNQTTNPTLAPVTTIAPVATAPLIPPLDIALYEQKLISLANNPPDPIVYTTVKTITQN